MNDDLNFVRAHVPDYRAYTDEAARHDSDERVRAFVGERIAQAQQRLADAIDEPTQKVVDETLMRCMFSDQVFVRKFEHARLDDTMVAALVRSDRNMIELGEKAAVADAASLRPILIDIDKAFEYRRGPEPVAD